MRFRLNSSTFTYSSTSITSNMINQSSAHDILFRWSHLSPLTEETDHGADHLTAKSPPNWSKVTTCLRTIPPINRFIIVITHTICLIHIWHAWPYFTLTCIAIGKIFL